MKGETERELSCLVQSRQPTPSLPLNKGEELLSHQHEQMIFENCDTFEVMESKALLFALLIGFLSGFRSLTPTAATAWGAHLGWLKLERPFSLIGTTASVWIFSALALAELVADKLPKTPNRTSPPGLIARIVMGALAGTCVALSAGGAAITGAVLGVLGAVAGTFAGYKARTGIVKALNVPDIYVALAEDLITIGGSFLIVSRV